MKIVLLILIGGYLIVSLLLYMFQEQFIFLGEPLEDDHKFSFDIPHSEIDINMEDGGRINMLHFQTEEPKGLILYFHGNAGNLAGWGFVAQDFIPMGYDVAIMDYRGYGKSTGKRTEETMLADALECYDHFKGNYPEANIIPYGRSLGTGIAAYVASKRQPGKLILETPYYNFTSLVQAHVPIFPVDLLLKFKFKTNRYVQDVKCPVYIFHGTDDSIVPFKQGMRLYESLDPERASMFVIEDGSHNNLSNFNEYWENLEKILE